MLLLTLLANIENKQDLTSNNMVSPKQICAFNNEEFEIDSWNKSSLMKNINFDGRIHSFCWHIIICKDGKYIFWNYKVLFHVFSARLLEPNVFVFPKLDRRTEEQQRRNVQRQPDKSYREISPI